MPLYKARTKLVRMSNWGCEDCENQREIHMNYDKPEESDDKNDTEDLPE